MIQTNALSSPEAFGARAMSVAGFATANMPAFVPPDAGTFDTYRRISAHPTVALAMRIVAAPVVANSWDVVADPKADPAAVELVRRNLLPLRAGVVADGLRALAYGFAPFEKVWTADGRFVVLKKLKPLLPDSTSVLVDDGGNFSGLRNQTPGRSPRDLPANKCFCFTYDGEYGNFYGRSRHENVRTAWSQAVQTADRLAQYHKKVSGVIAQLHYPEGTSRDASGAERPNDAVAQQVLEAVSMGRSVRFPNLFASVDDPRSAAELAGKSQWVLSQFDPGGTDHSGGLLSALAYYDKLLFRGWLRPERVGLEAQHGTRADAQEHTDSGIVDAELIDAEFARQFNAQVVDDLLELNYGPHARGSVRVEPSPIADETTATMRSVLTTILNHPATAQSVVGRIDVPAILRDLDVPVTASPQGDT